MVVIIGIVVVLILLWPAFASASRARQSHDLHRRVLEMGDVTQYNYDDVVRTLGNPTSISAVAAGGKFVQWMAPRYHIGMTFGANGECLGIDHESAV